MNVTLSQGVYVIACPHSTAALFGTVTGHIVYVHVIAIGLQLSQGTVYGSTGTCGELCGNVVR